jgi:predicted O-methyltransferase YrrM
MPSALAAPRVGAVLSRLYAAATHDSRHSSPSARARAAASPAERSRVFQEVSFPVSAEVGNLLYALVRASRPQTVVEFGTSFGVSTIYLAAAVADNGAGHVVTEPGNKQRRPWPTGKITVSPGQTAGAST